VSEGAISLRPGGFRLRVRLTPKSSLDRLDGPGVDAAGMRFLKARVRAVPADGAANAALEALLAKTLGLARSDVHVERGATSRIKTVAIDGDAQTLARAQALLEENRMMGKSA
jgi:uncharacterized protein YggU (UPF0235/DUF167 family)